jgi:hypothetical protein
MLNVSGKPIMADLKAGGDHVMVSLGPGKGARLVGPVMRETIQGEGKLLATRARTFYADFMISEPIAAASAGRSGPARVWLAHIATLAAVQRE